MTHKILMPLNKLNAFPMKAQATKKCKSILPKLFTD